MLLGYDDFELAEEPGTNAPATGGVWVLICPVSSPAIVWWTAPATTCEIYRIAYEHACRQVTKMNRRDRLASVCWN